MATIFLCQIAGGRQCRKAGSVIEHSALRGGERLAVIKGVTLGEMTGISFGCSIFTSVIIIHLDVLETGGVRIIPSAAPTVPKGNASYKRVHTSC